MTTPATARSGGRAHGADRRDGAREETGETMNLELDSPGWVRTDMTMNDITIQTGVANRAETDEPDAVNEPATWRARYEQAQQRIAALEAENQELFSRALRRQERMVTIAGTGKGKRKGKR